MGKGHVGKGHEGLRGHVWGWEGTCGERSRGGLGGHGGLGGSHLGWGGTCGDMGCHVVLGVTWGKVTWV